MFGSIVIFLVVLSVLVLVHELGHFLVARKFGILVEEFGFGLPPRVFGKKIGETVYSLNLLPFGGFVRLHGENYDGEAEFPQRSFSSKSKKVRTAVIVAGVIMNFLLAVVAFAVVYSFSGIPKTTQDVRIVAIDTNSPAQIGGLVVGDVVKSVSGGEVTSVEGFVSLVEEKKGQRVTLEVLRDEGGEKSTKKITLTPRQDPPEGEGPLGVVISSTEIYYPPVLLRPFVGAYYGFKEAFFWGYTVVGGIAKIFSDLFVGQAPKDIAGPVGIFAVTSQAAKFGILALVNFVGILSVNLAILNILPFPALDGGRLMFIGLEKVIGRKVLPKVESTIHTVGMIILLILIFAITAGDIKRLISAGSLSGFLDSVLKK